MKRGNSHLGNTDILHGALGPGDVDLMCGREYQQPRLVDLCARLGDLGQDGN